GDKPIQPYQITKRWHRLIKSSNKIKDKDGKIIKVTEDFYSLKHLFLDKLDQASDEEINLAKIAASHRTDSITKVYTV
ncbi:hypothetical protein GNY06_00230, partial [Elizabethkingia argentiflava]|nr:hypothetical protein [Elizabethkingia argenteiflava]